MSKGANGEGTVRQREGGRWEAWLVYTDPNTGQTKASILLRLQGLRSTSEDEGGGLAVESAAPLRDARRTVADCLGYWQRTTLAASSRKETTNVLYRHLTPAT